MFLGVDDSDDGAVVSSGCHREDNAVAGIDVEVCFCSTPQFCNSAPDHNPGKTALFGLLSLTILRSLL